MLAAIQVEKGQALAAEMRARGGDASFVEANVSARSRYEIRNSQFVIPYIRIVHA